MTAFSMPQNKDQITNAVKIIDALIELINKKDAAKLFREFVSISEEEKKISEDAKLALQQHSIRLDELKKIEKETEENKRQAELTILDSKTAQQNAKKTLDDVKRQTDILEQKKVQFDAVVSEKMKEIDSASKFIDERASALQKRELVVDEKEKKALALEQKIKEKAELVKIAIGAI